MKRSYPTLALLALAVIARGVPAQQPQAPRRPVVGRSVVATRYGIVAASQPLAARAGVQILEHGGNAVDAAIGANAVMGVVEPAMNGIGGDLFAIFYEAKTGRLHGLNSGGWAPTGLTAEFLKEKGLKQMPQRGIYSVTVPGAVAGWEALRAKFGALPMRDILSPAIFYADQGFPVTEIIAGEWAGSLKMLAAEPNAARTYLIDGKAPRAGQMFRNRDLAASLRLVASQGPKGFYEGKTADAILAISREKGGTMTAADLKEFAPAWVDPISTTYRGWRVYELPPNTQGIAALMMLNLMERFPLGEYGFHSPRALHTMIEAKKLAYADMLKFVGDPSFTRVPVPAMLDKDHAATRAATIDPKKAACSVQPSEFPGLTTSIGADTIYLSVVDRDGNIVSLIQSLYSGFGSGVVPPDTGFMLHNRGGGFTLQEGHPNTVAPRKRPFHTIIPAFMQKDDVRIGFGIMGGFNQAQAHAQFVANIADYGMTIQEALEAGRFRKNSFAGCDVEIEALVPAATIDELKSLGHVVRVVPPRTGTFGWGQAVMANGSGVHFGASEPRHDGAAIPEAPPVFQDRGRR
jgi:gamma-glutamyltranspeptidase/glutathione hydrolase